MYARAVSFQSWSHLYPYNSQQQYHTLLILGYVQGMSDLLAPVLAVMENEADAYWCFARQMDLIGGRFDGGQSYIIKEIQKILAYLQRLDPQLHALLGT